MTAALGVCSSETDAIRSTCLTVCHSPTHTHRHRQWYVCLLHCTHTYTHSHTRTQAYSPATTQSLTTRPRPHETFSVVRFKLRLHLLIFVVDCGGDLVQDSDPEFRSGYPEWVSGSTNYRKKRYTNRKAVLGSLCLMSGGSTISADD